MEVLLCLIKKKVLWLFLKWPNTPQPNGQGASYNKKVSIYIQQDLQGSRGAGQFVRLEKIDSKYSDWSQDHLAKSVMSKLLVKQFWMEIVALT